MLSIKNNMMAEVASRQLGKSYDALSTSVARLSSGLRINSAKDDAAGLAVRELIRADVAQLRQGSRNAADGVSMLQTAEGALGAIDDILVRMEELAEQASTDSYSAAQKEIMDAEFKQLSEEIDRIANNTAFNEKYLLNDNSQTYKIHVGTSGTIDISGKNMTAAGLDIASGSTEFIAGRSVASAGANYVTGNDAADALAFVFNDGAGTTHTLNVTVGDGSLTLQQMADALNAQSRSKIDGWNTAEIVVDENTGLSSLKLSAWKGGNFTDTTITNTGAVAWAGSADVVGVVAGGFVKKDGTATLDLKTTDNANVALGKVRDAIKVKDTARAEFGYLMNRLETAIGVVDIQAENLSSAESRISDVDVATEMAMMTRNQVLAQAGISMLSQANQIPQMAMSLLR